LEINSNNGRLNQLKATARSVAEDFVAAKEFAEKAINGGRSDSALRLIAGFASYQLKDYEGVIRHITVVSDVLPDDHPALRILVDSQLQLNMGEDANAVLTRVDDTVSDQLLLFPRASYGLIKDGDTEAAKEMIQQAENTGNSPEDLIRIGALKLSLNDLDGITDLETALTKAPDSYEAKSTLAGAYIVTKQIDKGLALAQKWQIEQPKMVEGYLLEADMLGQQNKLTEATQALEKAQAIDSENSFVQLASIRLDMILERYEQGLIKVESLLAKEPNNVNALASYYKIKSELGDPSIAIQKIENAAKNNIDNEGLTILFASALVADEKFHEAINELNKIDANRFTQNTYWRLKGMALYNTSNLTELLTHYTKWVSIFPDQIDATLGLLHILDLQRDFTKAADVAEDFLAIKEQVQIRMMAAYFLAMSENAIAAKNALKGIASEYQELPYFRGINARIAVLEGRGGQVVEDAEANYQARKSSDNLALYVQTLDSAGQTAQVFPIVQQHVTDFPADVRSKALFAARQVAIDSAAALASYEELLLDFPNDPGLLNNAGYLHFKANNIEKAFEYSAKANQINPKNLNYADTYAQVLLQRGETEQAVEAYNIAMTDTVSHQEIILNYIEALFKNNNELAAKRRIQQFKTRLKTQESKDRLFDLQVKYLN
jgi:putative PEP-CTERM system TPR-repeat lipoprotein